MRRYEIDGENRVRCLNLVTGEVCTTSRHYQTTARHLALLGWEQTHLFVMDVNGRVVSITPDEFRENRATYIHPAQIMRPVQQ